MRKTDFMKLQEQIDDLKRRLDQKSGVQFVPVPYQVPCQRPHYPSYPQWTSPYTVPTIWCDSSPLTDASTPFTWSLLPSDSVTSGVIS